MKENLIKLYKHYKETGQEANAEAIAKCKGFEVVEEPKGKKGD